MCNKSCNGCPFAFTEESEQIQNYGCLPTPYEIVRMRVEFGKTWACHKEPTKPCVGGINYLKEKGHEYKVIDKELVTEQSDFLVGFGKLISAEEKVKSLEQSNSRLLEDSRHWKKMFETAEKFIRRIKRKRLLMKNYDPVEEAHFTKAHKGATLFWSLLAIIIFLWVI